MHGMKIAPQRQPSRAGRQRPDVDAAPTWVDVRPAASVEMLVYPAGVAADVEGLGRALAPPISGPTRAMLFGPPGTGKTATLTNLAAKSAGPFWWVRADRLLTSFMGGSASNLTHLFQAARDAAAVLVFDDLDALARRRDDPREGGESRRLVVALLGVMDETEAAVSVLAATNLPQAIDSAVTRRFHHLVAFRPFGAAEARSLLRETCGLKSVSPEQVRLAIKMSPAEVVGAVRQISAADVSPKLVAEALRSRAEAMSYVTGAE